MSEKINIELTRGELEWLTDVLKERGYTGEVLSMLKKEIEVQDQPKIGDRCAFWNDDTNYYVVADYIGITIDGLHTMEISKEENGYYQNCAQIKKEAKY